MTIMRLNAGDFGLAAGILWGGAVLIITLLHIAAGWFDPWVNLLAGTYPGYDPSSSWGALAGLVAGFIDGFLAGLIFALIYNALVARSERAQALPSTE